MSLKITKKIRKKGNKEKARRRDARKRNTRGRDARRRNIRRRNVRRGDIRRRNKTQKIKKEKGKGGKGKRKTTSKKTQVVPFSAKRECDMCFDDIGIDSYPCPNAKVHDQKYCPECMEKLYNMETLLKFITSLQT